MIKLNREIKINPCENIILKYGSINKNEPKVVYVTGKMWVCPKYDGDFDTPIKDICAKFRKELIKILKESDDFDSRYILDFDMDALNFIKDKRKFFSFTFFIRQKGEKLISLVGMKNIILDNFEYLFKELENNLIENDFDVSKVKTDGN